MISIVITAFKNDKFIFETLESISDSIENIEYEILIGVDNCTITMDSLIDNFKTLPKNVKLFFFPKVGTYVIRNTLVKHSTYDKIIFIDSDDIISKKTIEFVYNKLDEFDVVKYYFAEFSGEFNKNSIHLYNKKDTSPAGSFSIKKNVFLNMGGFEPWFCAADGEFQWRVKSNNIKSMIMTDVGLYYRRHETNLTSGNKTGMKSPLRKYYHSIKETKIKNNDFSELEKISLSDFIIVNEENGENYFELFVQMNINNLYDFEKILEEKQQKNKLIEEKVLKPTPPPHEPVKITKTLEKTQKQINYEKVNQIFNNSKTGQQTVIRQLQHNNQPNKKLNSSNSKMFTKKKLR
jgi:glycosyltransferase involved in cell wall biosynthesis